jgi:O-antigen ligase
MERVSVALLCALVFSLPLEKALTVPGVGTISRAAGLAAFGAGALAVACRRAPRRPNAALLLAAVFVLWSGATFFWSVSPAVTAARFGTLAQLFAMFWLIWEVGRSEAAQAWLMRAYLAGASVSSVWTIVRAARNQQTYYRRFATAGFDPNDLGLTLALAIPMVLYLLSRTRGLAAWLLRLAAVLTVAAILLTASRTALVVACIGIVVQTLTWRRSNTMQRLSGIALLGLLLLGAVWLAPRASRQRLATLPAELAGGTFHGRSRIWKTGVKLLKHHGLAGVGAGAYPAAVRPWLGVPPVPGHEYTAHNTFLSVLVETGAVGFLIYSLLLATLALFAWMLDASQRALWLSSLVIWAAGVSTLSWENRKPTWLLFALITTAWARAYFSREPES